MSRAVPLQDRWVAKSVEEHPLYEVGHEVLSTILQRQPRAVLIENVVGWALQGRKPGARKPATPQGHCPGGAAKSRAAQRSHLQVFIEDLQSTGRYQARAIRLSLRPWVDAERERVYLLAVHVDEVADAGLVLDKAITIVQEGNG